MLTLTHASAEPTFVRTDTGRYLFGHFCWWLPTSLQVKQWSSRCNLAISFQVNLVALLRAGRMDAGFDVTERGRLYMELAEHSLQLVCWPAVFVLVFVFVSRYWLPPKLAAGVQSLMSFKS